MCWLLVIMELLPMLSTAITTAHRAARRAKAVRYRLVATATRLVATTPTGCHRNLPTPCYTVVARARSGHR